MESNTPSMKPRTGDVKITEHVDFNGLLLSDAVLTGLKNAGYVRPSPIQLKAIPLGRCGLDLVVQAKSGTGKTCVFSVVALEGITTDTSNTQVLVLAPTREIAVQIWEVINTLGSALPGLRCYTFIGGMPLADDKIKLKKCHIAVGTPGRVKQLIELQVLNTESIRLFVLDEADKLMEAGFQEAINWIYSSLPDNKQMLALSATFPEVLAQHLTAYMRNPTFVRLNITDPALLGIRQYYKQVPFHPLPQKAFESKCQALMCLLSEVVFQQCLVFSNYQLRAQSLSDILNAKGWPATYISGSQDQEDRLTAMAKLKKFKCRILISTDLTSRGIDAENVNLIINLDIPYDHETYLHRIGRAGRFGTYGAAVSFVSLGKETANLRKIERDANTKIKVLPDPVPSDLTRSSGFVDLDELVTTEPLARVTIDRAVAENGSQKDMQPAASSSGNKCVVELGRGECNDSEPVKSPIGNGCSHNTIPDLIDSITQNVQIGYQEAEDVLDGELEQDAKEQEPVKGENGSYLPHHEDDSYDMPSPMAIPSIFKLHCQVNLSSDVCTKNVNKKSDVTETDTCHSRIDMIPEVNGNITRKETERHRLDQVLQAYVEPGDVDMNLPMSTVPIRGCSAQKQPRALGYRDIMADLKHFRNTGKLLHDINSSEPNNAETAIPIAESFDEAVKDVANFLHHLHLDPVKYTASTLKNKSKEKVDHHKEHVKEVNKETMETARGPASSKQIMLNSLDQKQDKQNHDTALPAHNPIQARTMKTGVGARPKDATKSYNTRSKLHKAEHKLGKVSNSPVSSSTVTDEDRVLGLDYMKKLTACLDPHSADESDSINETDTTETESSYSSGDSKDTSVYHEDDYDGEDEDYYCEEKVVDGDDQGRLYRDVRWTSVQSRSNIDKLGAHDDPEVYYEHSKSQQNIPVPEDYNIFDDGEWNDDQGVYYETPQEQAWYDGCHPDVQQHTGHDLQYPYMTYGHNGWFPHQLWNQCHSLLGSINAMQASQYAWFCQQQYLYHSQNARHFHNMYSKQCVEKSGLQRELRKQREHIRNTTKMYAKSQPDL